MKRQLKDFKINSADADYNFREVLFEDFKSLPAILPISNWWGYSEDKPIEISLTDLKSSKFSNQSIPQFEMFLVMKRLYEELIIFRTPQTQYCNIVPKLVKQSLLINPTTNNKIDHLVFDVTCYKQVEYDKIIKEEEATKEDLDRIKYHFQTEYYFELFTETFKSNLLQKLISGEVQLTSNQASIDEVKNMGRRHRSSFEEFRRQVMKGTGQIKPD